jgi:hypothetical protein
MSGVRAAGAVPALAGRDAFLQFDDLEAALALGRAGRRGLALAARLLGLLGQTWLLFEKHGMTVIGFWTPLKQKGGEEKLIYLLAYPSKAAADRSWKAFRDDPAWKKVREESEKNGPLLARPPESVYLEPTDYSPLK